MVLLIGRPDENRLKLGTGELGVGVVRCSHGHISNEQLNT